MSNLELLCTLLNAKNELEQVRQRTRQKLIRLRRYQFHVQNENFDAKNPPRTTRWWSARNSVAKPTPYLVPLVWIKATKSERKYQLLKAETEAKVAALAVHEFTRNHGKQIREILKKEKWNTRRCTYNHYYTGVYGRDENGAFLSYVTGISHIRDIALKALAEKYLIGGDNG